MIRICNSYIFIDNFNHRIVIIYNRLNSIFWILENVMGTNTLNDLFLSFLNIAHLKKNEYIQKYIIKWDDKYSLYFLNDGVQFYPWLQHWSIKLGIHHQALWTCVCNSWMKKIPIPQFFRIRTTLSSFQI